MWDELEKQEPITTDIDDDSIFDDFPRKRTRRKKDEKITNEYVNKDEMWMELYNYYKSLGDAYDWSTQKVLDKNIYPPFPPKLSSMIDDIATKMGYRANFCTYSWKDDMIGDAILKMVKAVRDGSFECYTNAEVISGEDEDGMMKYIDKKGQPRVRQCEPIDEYFQENSKHYVKFKANPFGYFSVTTTHSYLNRIKKEKLADDTKRAYQRDTWDKLYSNELFKNVRRPKFIESDENDAIFEE